MAGICTGPGLTTTSDGKLTINGARSAAWPNEGSCSIAQNNGLRVDPGTGKLWVPPAARMIPKLTAGSTIEETPTVIGTFTLEDLEQLQVSPQCSAATYVAHLSGGYLGQRMGNGNWWAVQRYVTVYVNAVVVAFTGLQVVGGLENNSGGVLGASGAVDPLTITVELSAGQTVKVVTHYEHRRLAFTASGANGYEFRTPSIQSVLYTHP